jgi:hypothetical protein
MYVGPSIPGIVETGKLFNNGFTPAVADAINKCSAINELMVPTNKIGEALNDIKHKRGAYHAFYNTVKSFCKKEG